MQRIAAVSVLAAASLLSLGHTAHADRNPKVATGLSIAGSVAGPVMMWAGIESDQGGLVLAGAGTVVLGPSLGEWYSGKPVTIGMGLRAAGSVAFLKGAIDTICFDDPCTATSGSDTALMALGGAALVGGTLYDIFDAAPSARSWNAEHHIEVAPTMVKGAPGLAVAGEF